MGLVVQQDYFAGEHPNVEKIKFVVGAEQLPNIHKAVNRTTKKSIYTSRNAPLCRVIVRKKSNFLPLRNQGLE